MNNSVPSAMPSAAVMIKLGIMAMLPLLLLGACAEPKATATIAATPSPVSSPAPTPSCNAPLGNQADRQDPSTPWQRAVDRTRAEDCMQALDPRLAPIRPLHLASPREEVRDGRTLDLAPMGLRARESQGRFFDDRIPIPESCHPRC